MWLAVMLGDVLDFSLGRIMSSASCWTGEGHRGAIATDLDSRRVTEGMQDEACVGRPTS